MGKELEDQEKENNILEEAEEKVKKEKPKTKGDLLYCQKCQDYHWTSEPHIESWLGL